MIRVVLDTNIVVSSQMHPGGLPAIIFNLAINRRLVDLCISAPILAEYEEVLRRPRLKLRPERVADVMAAILAAGKLVRPTETVSAASDPDDNIFLECGQAAHADYLVTGNTKDFPQTWLSTRIVTVREFFAILSAARPSRPMPPS